MRTLSQRACAALAVLLAGLAVVTLDTSQATAARAHGTTPKATTSTVPPRFVGVAVPGAPTDLSTLTDLTAELERFQRDRGFQAPALAVGQREAGEVDDRLGCL